MPIPFTCPHCGKHADVSDRYAGQSGPCAACGQWITIPAGATKTAPSPRAAPVAEQSDGTLGRGSAIGSGGIVPGLIVDGLVLLLLCGGILVALPRGVGKHAVRRTQCSNHLKQIAFAFHNYHDTYGSLPPAYLAGEDGRPMHSWRVLLLPFLEQQALYDAYNFDEPWHSPVNRMVVETKVPVYTCPSDRTAFGSTTTNYMLITGPGTVFDGTEATRFHEIRDGLSNTLLVVEVRDTGVRWAEPVDLDVDQLVLPFAGGRQSPGSRHVGGINVATCDGAA
jgi:hypothetical protein